MMRNVDRSYYGGRLANLFAVVCSSLLILARRIPKRSNISGKRPVRKPRKRRVSAVEIDSREVSKMRN
jgi:hypothetical protein